VVADQGSRTFAAVFNTIGTHSFHIFETVNIRLVCAPSDIRVHDGNLSEIPVAARDLVFDPLRQMLYTTSNFGIERFDLASQTLLAPWKVGNDLVGLDITSDGSTLYAVEGLPSAVQGMVRKVDIATGTRTTLTYDLAEEETGGWDLAIASNGKALLSANSEGLGLVPLRELNLSTGVFAERRHVHPKTRVYRGGDRSLVYFTVPNITTGPISTYDATTDQFPRVAEANAYVGDIAAVNRNGTLIAMELSNGVVVVDREFRAVQNLSRLDGGTAFDPDRDLLFGISSLDNQLIAYDSNT
jgi:hypothetical protein